MTVFAIYLDESHQQDARVTAIAGYAADHDAWSRLFDPRWREDVLEGFDLLEFHAATEWYLGGRNVDCAKRRDKIFEAAVDVVANPPGGMAMRAFGSAIVYPAPEELGEFGQQASLEKDGYRCAAYDLMRRLVEWSVSSLPNGSRVEIFPDHKIKCMQYVTAGLRQALQQVNLTDSCIDIVIPDGRNDSKKLPALQVADLYAFEAAREAVRRLDDKCWEKNNARYSLRRLLSEAPCVHECRVTDMRALALMLRGDIPPGVFPQPILFETGNFDPRLIWKGGSGTIWVKCGDGESYIVRRITGKDVSTPGDAAPPASTEDPGGELQ